MEKRAPVDIENDLIAHLAAANISKEHLAEISKSIASSLGSGLKIVDWWIIGIPAFEQVVIQAQLPIKETETLNRLILNERFKGIDILRKGIPKPDFFQIDLTIQNVRSNMPKV